MKMYKVNVNGTMYEITLEVCDVDEAKAAVKEAPAQAAPVEAAPVEAAPTKAAPTGGEKVLCPMPGTILSVAVENGQHVEEGDLLFILEAMKMENELFSPCAGTVTVSTSKGSTVDTGTLLATIA